MVEHMTAKAIRENASSEWHLERDGAAECGAELKSGFELRDLGDLWNPRDNKLWCGLCIVLAEADPSPIVTAELTRQRYQPQRMTVLKNLQKHLREKPKPGPEPPKIPLKDSAPPHLAPHIVEPEEK